MVLSATMEELRDAERALGVNGCSEFGATPEWIPAGTRR